MWTTRLFRALLSLYPREFRDRYGREVVLVFRDRYRDAAGPLGRAVVCLEAAAGVLKEAPREHMHMILQDLRFAVRMARRTPAFTLTAIVTLALGIGANGAIFQMIDAVGLQPLPVQKPYDLAEVRIVGGNGGFGINPDSYGGLTRPLWQEIQAHQEAFVGIAAWATIIVRVGERTALRRQRTIVVSGDFFRVLGVAPYRGRLLEAADEQSGCPAAKAVVSHDYWRRTMAERDVAAGVPIKIDLQPVEIVGVTPPGFFGVAVGDSFDIALPFCQPKELRRDVFSVSVIGRLRPDWRLTRASAHLDALSPGIFEAAAPTGYSPESIKRFKEFRLAAYSFAQGSSWLRSEYTQSLRVLLAIAALVLLLAAANLANLLLARGSSREREVAVRLALGASRAKLVRQFLTESVLLAGLGALLSLLLAHTLSRALVWTLTTDGTTPALPLATNWRVLVFTAVVACGTWIVFGIAPALRATGIQPSDAMKHGGRSQTASVGQLSTQRTMVVMQVTVSLVLLVAALLFVRSFWNLTTLDPGMRRSGITIAFLGYPELKLSRQGLIEYQRQLVDEIRALPGIVNAATTTNIPLLGSSWGHGVEIGGTEDYAQFTWVSPEYFNTMEISVLRGRGFSDRDTDGSSRVAVVNEAFVNKLVGNGDAIGKSLRSSPEPGYPATVYEIVGVIADTKYSNLRRPTPPMVFAPDTQHPSRGRFAALMIHAAIEPAAANGIIMQHIARSHPHVVMETAVFHERIADRLVRDRLLAILAGFFGLLAAVLAMIGLYGMISFAVASRRQEIGIRIALGADRITVVALMMREARRLVAVGIVIGTIVALVAGRATATLLFGVTPYDPLTLAAAVVLLALIAAMASYIPARRASRLNPLDALRQE